MYAIQVCLRSMYLGTDQQCYTVRIAKSAIAGKQEGILYLLMLTLGLVAPPILLYITWTKQLVVLRQVKVAKSSPAVMWACITWMPLVNTYFAIKFMTSTSRLTVNKIVQRRISFIVTFQWHSP